MPSAAIFAEEDVQPERGFWVCTVSVPRGHSGILPGIVQDVYHVYTVRSRRAGPSRSPYLCALHYLRYTGVSAPRPRYDAQPDFLALAFLVLIYWS